MPQTKKAAPKSAALSETTSFQSMSGIHQHRTWKTLKAMKLEEAIKEARTTDFEISNGGRLRRENHTNESNAH